MLANGEWGAKLASVKHTLTKLSNGLRVLVVPLPSLESVSVTLWVGVGSRYETKEKNGISHFLEHMPAKGTLHYPTADALSTEIDSIGAESNAGTSREWTDFYLKAQSQRVETAFRVLSDMVLHPLLKQEDIDMERGVILEEIAMKNDDPSDKVGDNFLELIYPNNPLGWDIAGKPETVKSINRDDFLRYKESHYHTDNMLLTVSGGITLNEVEKLAEKYFSQLTKGKKSDFEKFKDIQKKPQLHIEYKKSEQAHLFLGFLGLSRTDPERYVETILSAILGRGMSSRLFREVREKRGLAYAVGTSASRHIDVGLFATYAGVALKKIEEALKVIVDQHHGITDGRYPISDAELNKAKEYIKGRTSLALEDTLSVNDFYGQQALFLSEISDPDDVFAKIDKVTIEDCVRVAKKIFDPKKINLAVIGPYKDNKIFENLIQSH